MRMGPRRRSAGSSAEPGKVALPADAPCAKPSEHGGGRCAKLLAEVQAHEPDAAYVADQLRQKWPKLASFIDDSEIDVLSHLDFPERRRTKVTANRERFTCRFACRVLRGANIGFSWCC